LIWGTPSIKVLRTPPQVLQLSKGAQIPLYTRLSKVEDIQLMFRIRYAAPPLGSLRWQAPLRPAVNRTAVISAADFGPACPNSPLSLGVLGTFGAIPGDEDCLNLNVYAPTTAPGTGLPVLVYIHGGGYGAGDGKQDMTSIINTNGNSFIAVTIQYRVSEISQLS
jgi:carboxylesterase type B